MSGNADSTQDGLALSIIVPARNEEENLLALIEEVALAIARPDLAFELIVIDDGSTDGSPALLLECMERFPWLRTARMKARPPEGVDGKGAAYRAGFEMARGRLVATLDADLQNDPADIPAMIEAMTAQGCDLVQGDRSAKRRDNLVRRISSRVGRLFRRLFTGDTIRDTACGLRVMKRCLSLELPMEYRGLHRFIGCLAVAYGYRVMEMPVNHRPRLAGAAKFGVRNRAFTGLRDLLAVKWMRNRLQRADYAVVEPVPGKAGRTAGKRGGQSR